MFGVFVEAMSPICFWNRCGVQHLAPFQALSVPDYNVESLVALKSTFRTPLVWRALHAFFLASMDRESWRLY
jgi:hypothetical protein